MRVISALFCILIGLPLLAQDKISGQIFGEEGGGEITLPYASVLWLNTTRGAVADENGKFSIARVEESSLLLISYTGFANDTIDTKGKSEFRIVLKSTITLDEAVVKEEQKATSISSIQNMKTEVLGKGELKKAACCNLSESFETNPTVEVSYSDAFTGILQIQMLFLSGIYAQTLVENIPMVHGLNASTGLTFIPGPFVENIYLSKGAGSVVYGFESMSGQINIDLFKPETAPKLHLNAYVNQFGRSEFNVITRAKINSKWNTSLMAHGNITKNQRDPNNDGFYNLPSGNGINVINRYKYNGEKWEGMVGVKLVNDQRISGQLGYTKGMLRDSASPYGVEYLTRQIGTWAKLGRPATEEKQTSIGFMFHANHY